jgi:hypothetical protein
MSTYLRMCTYIFDKEYEYILFRIESMDTYRYEYIPTYVYIHFDKSMSTYFSDMSMDTNIFIRCISILVY